MRSSSRAALPAVGSPVQPQSSSCRSPRGYADEFRPGRTGTLDSMAYDLAFWTDTRTERPEPNTIYAELLAGRAVEGIGPFNAVATLDALAEKLPGLKPSPTTATGSATWEAPSGATVFEFSWSPQHLIVTARGRYTGDQMNTIIDVGTDVGGGRLYDPQTDERFDR